MSLTESAGLLHRDQLVATGINLHVVERPGQSTPVILLHGIWGSWQAWLPVLDLPTDPFAGRPLLLLDLRGHGRSGKPVSGYDLADYAADVAAFIQRLDDPRVILVGHSLGALTCLGIARALPERIESLILEEPPLPQPTDPANLNGFWADFAEAVVGLSTLKHQPDEVIVQQLMAKDAELTRAEAEDAMRSIVNTADGVFTSIMNGEFHGDHITDRDRPLEKLPALVFQGALPDHRALADEGVAQLRRLLPRLHVISLPDTGHSIHRVAPEAFCRAVTHFLSHTT